MTLILLGLVLLALAQHPYVTFPASLLLWRRLAPRPISMASPFEAPPSVSILCCCHNEEQVIADKVEAQLRTVRHYGGEAEMLFYLDDCTDRTAEILRGFGTDVRVVEGRQRAGKSVGMAALVAQSTGRLLVFTDANTFPAENAIAEIARPFADPEVGGVSARLLYVNEASTEVARLNGLYWRLEEWIKAAESATGSIMGADGGLFAIRRELYVPTPPDIIDDLHTSLNVILAGKRLISYPGALAYEKTATDRDDEFRRKVRISCRAFNCCRRLGPALGRSSAEVVYKLASHKLLRWFGLPLGVAGLSAIAAGLLMQGASLAGWLVLLAPAAALLLGRLDIKPFTALYEFALSLWAVTLGLAQSLRGLRYQTWSAAASGR